MAPLSGSPSWTDITDYYRGLDIDRGRSSEMTSTEPGTLSLVLDNADGRFTPGRPTSPYYPNVLPNRRIRVTALVLGITYLLFDGFVDGWPVRFGGPDYAESTITATDAFKILASIDLTSTYGQELLATGPVAYYPLTEESGSESAGNLAGTPWPAAQVRQSKYGVAGGEFSFGESGLNDGMGTALHLSATADAQGYLLDLGADGPTVPWSTGGFTFGLWAKQQAAPTLLSQAITQYRSGSDIIALLVQFDPDGDVLWLLGDGVDVASPRAGAGSANDGKWHFWTFAFGTDRRTAKLYRDGVLLDTEVAPAVIDNTGWPLGPIGLNGAKRPAGFSSRGDLTYGHFSIWHREVSAAEIATLAAAGPGFEGEDEAARIDRILDYAGWPTADRNLEPGKSSLAGASLDGTTALDALRAAAESSSGVLFVDGQRRVTFHNRHHRINAAVRVALNSSAALGIEDDLGITLDDEAIRNDVRGTRTGGATVRATDPRLDDSATAPHPRTVDSFEIGVATDSELTDAVNYRLSRYKDPALRCPRISVQPTTSDDLWPHALGREIGDRITLASLPDAGPTTGLDFYIESVRQSVVLTNEGPSWTTTWDLSPADVESYWVLGDTTLGVLGSTTRLAY
jgi:hypothetical protein